MESDQEPTFQIYQKPEEEIIINPEEYYGLYIDKLKKIPMRKLLPNGFLKSLDPHFKLLCRQIKANLKEENYEIMAITGFAGTGKSQLGAITGCLIDPDYSFGDNINFLPTSKEVEKDYLKLRMYGYLHIDEASRSIHKHQWYEKTQQKLSMLYDTEREGHFIASCLIMPRFNNFTENFRNFFIKYWINIPTRGIAIVYKRDEDKDTKDPWNVDDSIKLKKKYWGNKRVFERSVSDIIRMEQRTKNYLFYFQIPEIPKEVWSIYKVLKKQSRIDIKDSEAQATLESYQDKMHRLRTERMDKISKFRTEGYNIDQIAVMLKCSSETIRKAIREIDARIQLEKPSNSSEKSTVDTINNIFNLNTNDKLNKSPEEFNNI